MSRYQIKQEDNVWKVFVKLKYTNYCNAILVGVIFVVCCKRYL